MSPNPPLQTQTTPLIMVHFYLRVSQFTEDSVGNVPWLFQDNFCNFTSVHLGFNVSLQFTQVSLGNCVVQTVCPDRFCGKDGCTPPGSVCVTVTGHNRGAGIQHLTIPGHYLTLANPSRKQHLCLVLKGAKAGNIVWIKECRRKAAQVVTEEGQIFPFSDICAVFEFDKNFVV